MATDEEKEIIRLESVIEGLNAEVLTQKNHVIAAKSEAKTNKNNYFSQGIVAEQKRILAVSRLPEFQGREKIALKMALSDSPQSEPQAIGSMLRYAPKASSGGQLDAHMRALGNPDVGADLGEDLSQPNPLESIAKGVL